VCAAFLWTKPRTRDFSIALLGALVGLAMLMMKFLPFVPGHFSAWEWLALGIWILLGTVIGRPQAAELAADKSIAT
jgi:hypothetical protein